MKSALLNIALVCLTVSAQISYGVTGCSLDDPDRDVRRIFPEATGFRTDFINIGSKGGGELVQRIETVLGDKLDPVYEGLDVDYAFYTVLRDKEEIGIVHGVNQKGKYGGMQLIIATDLKGVIRDFYYQKISSPESKKFRDKSFTEKFKGLTLVDFYIYKGVAKETDGENRVAKISDPSEKNAGDFQATLRGVMKNLILLDEFKMDGKCYKEYFKQGQENENAKK